MAIQINGNSLLLVKPVITDSTNTPVTNFGVVEVPASEVLEGAGAMTTQVAFQANSVAADVATLVTDFNALLTKLKAAGVMASS